MGCGIAGVGGAALAACVAIASLALPLALALAEDTTTPDFTEFSLEALTNLEVISVSKRPERLNDAAAAIFVITADEIRRSGATSIPELFHMVPGMDVARIDGNKWAVSARGFNMRFGNKLLVLIDGRSIYVPAFSGVFWDVEGLALADIERIEVIRGPGATMWGANAVNGVINIITYHSDQTRGVFASALAGTEERFLSTARLGGNLGARSHYRVTGDFGKRDDTADAAGDPNGDGWSVWRVGSRVDWQVSDVDDLTVRSNYVYDKAPALYPKALLTPPYSSDVSSSMEYGSGDIQAGWQRRLSPVSQLDLLAYFVGESIVDSLTNAYRTTLDLELRHSLAAGSRHSLIWGAGYRTTHDDFEPRLTVWDPASKQTELLNAFAQDDIALRYERLRLVLGAKLEHNTVSGSELQPNARVVWTPNPDHTAWAAVSRAVRTPSRYEQGVSFDSRTIPPGTMVNPGPLPVVIRVIGNPDIEDEVLLAYEAGYRVVPLPNLSADMALFYNFYDDLRSSVIEAPIPVLEGVPHLVTPVRLANTIEGETRGLELALEWRATARLRLHGAYSYFDEERRLLAGSLAVNENYLANTTPRHRVSVRTSADLARDIEFDLWLKYSSEIPAMDRDDIVNLDARIGWRCSKHCELSVVGQNLLQPEVNEFRDTWLGSRTAWIQRGVFGKVALWF